MAIPVLVGDLQPGKAGFVEHTTKPRASDSIHTDLTCCMRRWYQWRRFVMPGSAGTATYLETSKDGVEERCYHSGSDRLIQEPRRVLVQGWSPNKPAHNQE